MGSWYFWIYILGSPMEAERYYCRITLTSGCHEERVKRHEPAWFALTYTGRSVLSLFQARWPQDDHGLREDKYTYMICF